MSQAPPVSSSGENAGRLPQALRRVFRPLVKLMLGQNIPFQQAVGLLKQVYVDVAVAALGQSGKRASDSRVSLITGVNRKELKRLRETSQVDEEMPRSVSLGAQLVARWTSETRFLDAQGRPRALPRSSDAQKDGTDAPSFDELVTSVSTDIHPRSVLDEWLRLGIVRLDEEKRIHLMTSAFVPRRGFDEKLFYFGRNCHDHLDTTVRNLQGDEPSLLERSVHYDNLSPEDVNLLARFAEQEGMKLLEAVNRLARDLRDEGAGHAGHGAEQADEKAERINFGLYFYRGRERGEASKGGSARGGERDE